MAARKLYTDNDEATADVRRPVLLNGVNSVITAPDLADRVIQLHLSDVRKYKEEKEALIEFEGDYPAILGGLLDLYSATLKALPEVHPEILPRMADFARLGEAMCIALGLEPGTFIDAYERNREQTQTRAIQASPVIDAILEHMQDKPTGYQGSKSYASWLQTLRWNRFEHEGWPRSAKGLSDAVDRAGPALLRLGIRVIKDPKRRNDGYHLILKKIPEQSTQSTRCTRVLREFYDHVGDFL